MKKGQNIFFKDRLKNMAEEADTILFPIEWDNTHYPELDGKTPEQISEMFLEDYVGLCKKYKRTFQVTHNLLITPIEEKKK